LIYVGVAESILVCIWICLSYSLYKRHVL